MMKTLLLHARDQELLDRMRELLPKDQGLSIHALDPAQNLLDFLLFQIPDLVILAIDPESDDYIPVFEKLNEDPWMSSISFLVVSPDVDATIELYRSFGISTFLDEGTLTRDLPRAVRILIEGHDPLQGANLLKRLTALSGELTLPTDLFLAPYYAAFFSNYLYKEGHVSDRKRDAIHLSLTELLANAMEHGNAGITYEEKTAFLEKSRSVQALVDERMANPPYAGRKARLAYSISHGSSTFQITDEGDGFDTTKVLNATVAGGLFKTHGRGILMSRGSVDRLTYNAKGNSVTFEVKHDGSEKSVPPGFVDAEPRRYEPGEVVFREGDVSDRLYYIVSGAYDVLISGQPILTVGPADIFIGEMSFIVGNRRTATVIASQAGQLVDISREVFTQAVKTHPNYAVFLCKLLARRLKESNERYASLVPGSSIKP